MNGKSDLISKTELMDWLDDEITALSANMTTSRENRV